jgi:hypothetical protein
MSGQSSRLARQIARRLAAHAAGLLPESRAPWAQAMCHEVEHIARDRDALYWAFGCVVASYLERSRVMNVGTLRISRWVLALEMLMCFFWLTWMFGALASRGVYGFAGPLPIDTWFITMLFSTVLGPLGLAVAFKSIVLDRPRLSRLTKVALFVPAAWTFLAFGVQLVTRGWLAGSNDRPLEALGLFILFAVLPALGVAHLVYLSRAKPHRVAVA